VTGWLALIVHCISCHRQVLSTMAHHHHHDSEPYHGDPLEPPMTTEERESDEIEEKKHFQKVLMALAFYRRHSLIMNNRRRHDYNLIPQRHKELLPQYLQKVDEVDKLIEHNALVLKEIVKASGIFSETEVQATIMDNRGKQVRLYRTASDFAALEQSTVAYSRSLYCLSFLH
jgi:hypothetical protein